VEPRQEVIRTHRTYADEWMAKDTAERRQMLVEAGVRLTVKRGTRGGWRKLDESRVSFEIREAFHRGAVDALLAVREDTENDNRLAVPTPEGTRLRLWESETNSAAQEAA
jgi:transcriptional regulator with AAA-type ATPase domain